MISRGSNNVDYAVPGVARIGYTSWWEGDGWWRAARAEPPRQTAPEVASNSQMDMTSDVVSSCDQVDSIELSCRPSASSNEHLAHVPPPPPPGVPKHNRLPPPPPRVNATHDSRMEGSRYPRAANGLRIKPPPPVYPRHVAWQGVIGIDPSGVRIKPPPPKRTAGKGERTTRSKESALEVILTGSWCCSGCPSIPMRSAYQLTTKGGCDTHTPPGTSQYGTWVQVKPPPPTWQQACCKKQGWSTCHNEANRCVLNSTQKGESLAERFVAGRSGE